MTIDDIEFEDAVIQIPKNSVRIRVEVETYEKEGSCVVTGTLLPPDIREAFQTFKDTCNGDYPEYTLTDEMKALYV